MLIGSCATIHVKKALAIVPAVVIFSDSGSFADDVSENPPRNARAVLSQALHLAFGC